MYVAATVAAGARLVHLSSDTVYRGSATRALTEVDEPDPGLALARQHPHQIGIVHRIERVILQRAFVQRHGTDKQVALIDGAAGFRKGRRHQHDRIA